MSERKETGFNPRLDNFRKHFKLLSEQFAQTDGTIVGVVDVEELGEEECALWEEYSDLLKSSVVQNADYFSLSSQSHDLIPAIKVLALKAQQLKQHSKSAFYSWMNNRLLILINDTFMMYSDPTMEAEIKEELQLEIDKFLK